MASAAVGTIGAGVMFVNGSCYLGGHMGYMWCCFDVRYTHGGGWGKMVAIQGSWGCQMCKKYLQ